MLVGQVAEAFPTLQRFSNLELMGILLGLSVLFSILSIFIFRWCEQRAREQGKLDIDAPIEQVMYVDKRVKDHNLLQTIARVNRVARGKTRHAIAHRQNSAHIAVPQRQGLIQARKHRLQGRQ